MLEGPMNLVNRISMVKLGVIDEYIPKGHDVMIEGLRSAQQVSSSSQSMYPYNPVYSITWIHKVCFSGGEISLHKKKVIGKYQV